MRPTSEFIDLKSKGGLETPNTIKMEFDGVSNSINNHNHQLQLHLKSLVTITQKQI